MISILKRRVSVGRRTDEAVSSSVDLKNQAKTKKKAVLVTVLLLLRVGLIHTIVFIYTTESNRWEWLPLSPFSTKNRDIF